jgi:hypothetical protein
MNYKSKLMHDLKNVYGGKYTRKDGRWYWKQTDTDTEILVTSGWLINKLKNKNVEPEVIKQKEVIKKSPPKKKKEEVKPENIEQQ